MAFCVLADLQELETGLRLTFAEISRSRLFSLTTVLAFQAEFNRTLVLMFGIASHLST